MRSLLLSFVLLVAASVSAQEIKYCGQTEATEKLFQHFPQLGHEAEAIDEAFELEYQNKLAERSGGQVDTTTYIIPVVFHIIHDNGAENISDEQVYSAIEVLNRDFAFLNSDADDIIPEFADLPSDVHIEFRLAKRDPQGNCTKGITRIESPLTYDGDEAMKSLIQWPRDMYMNVWVCAYAAGAAGYTFLPSSVNSPFSADIDGIVLKHDYTGDMGTSSVYRSRTLTHEVGHWLNLRHTWGSGNSPGADANCDMDDNVPDTPNTVGWQSCNLQGESCGSLDNVQNYMDYSYCSRMFTDGQRTRMRTAVTSNTAERNQLWQQSNLIDTGVLEESILCEAAFSVDKQIICVGDSIQFSDESFHGQTEWTWDFGNFSLSGSDEELYANPLITFDEPGVYNVTFTVGNGMESVSVSESAFIRVLPPGAMEDPIVEGFEAGIDEDSWFIYNQHDNVTWELTSSAAYTGGQCVRIRNRNNTIEFSRDYLTSSTIDLSNALYAEISYKYAYCNLPEETDDRLRLQVTNNCGETWLLREIHRGITDLPTAPPQSAPFVPSGPDEWLGHTEVIDNPDYLIDNFRVRFDFEGRGGNHVYLDDINITVYTSEDVSVIDLVNGFTMSLYPNPAQGNSRLEYFLPTNAALTIDMVDMMGRQVTALFQGTAMQGQHVQVIDLNGLSAGIYLVRVQLGDDLLTRRLVVN